MSARVAILVDGDNISACHAAAIASAAGARGAIHVRRAYQNARQSGGWHESAGYLLVHTGSGKNATDMFIAVDAIELALAGVCDRFVLASSDRDFTYLALRLRERGHTVVGAGEAKTPPHFRAACTSFVELVPAQSLVTAVETTAPRPVVSDLDRRIHVLIGAVSQGGRGMRLAELAPRIHQSHGVQISKLPERTWRAYFTARPALFDIDPRGPDAHVRYKPKAFAATNA